MAIANVASSVNGYQASPVGSAFKQRDADFKALDNALQSGDLSGAQKAFTALQQDTKNLQSLRGTAGPQPTGQSSPLQNDIQALQSTLQSGDLSGAQKAFATLQQDPQNIRHTQGRNHAGHVHHRQNDGDADDGGAGAAGSSPATYSVQSTLQVATQAIGATVDLSA